MRDQMDQPLSEGLYDIQDTYELQREKTGLLGFWPGLTQTGLYSLRRWLEAWNFVMKKKRGCTYVAKTKVLIRCAVPAQLICTFVFAKAKISFSHDVAHMTGQMVDEIVHKE